jgi:thiol:disulfide interchange protein DsbD
MLFQRKTFWWIALALWMGSVLHLSAASHHAAVEALPEYTYYRPGSPLRVAFVFKIEDGWHTFWTNPGAIPAESASVEWKLPAGWRSEGLQFPAPQRLGAGSSFVFGYTGEVALLDTLVPPEEEDAGEVNLQAKVTWQVSGTETLTEETRCTLSFLHAGKSPVRPLRADRFRIWQGRIPRANRNVRFKLEKKFLARNFELTFPGSWGEARPEFFPDQQVGLDASKPLRAKYLKGTWIIEIPLDSADSKRPKNLEGVLEPGPTGGAPVWFSIRVPKN